MVKLTQPGGKELSQRCPLRVLRPECARGIEVVLERQRADHSELVEHQGISGWGGKKDSCRNEAVLLAEGGAKPQEASRVTWLLGIYEHFGLMLVSLRSMKAGTFYHQFIIVFPAGRKAKDSIRLYRGS